MTSLKPSVGLHLKVVDDRSDFELLKGPWNELVRVSAGGTPFMTWQWLDVWLEEYRRTDQRLLVLTAWENERLVAGLPLLYSRRRWLGLCAVRQLEVVGTGEPEWEEVCGEYSDLLTEPDQKVETGALFATYLQALPWDQFILRKVLADSLLDTLILPRLKRVIVERRFCGYRYRVALPPNLQEYLNQLGRSMQRKIRKLQKLTASSTFQLDFVKDPKKLPGVLEELAQLHQKRWQERGKPGAFRSSRFRRFHAKVSALFLQEGWLRLLRIADGDEAVMVNYNVRHGDTEYYYQSGLDMNQYRSYSLGVLAHVYAIEGAMRDGLNYYDFMHAASGSYKNQYSCELTEMNDLKLIKLSPVGKLMSSSDRLTQALKQLVGGRPT